jgi:hypothetical protein
MGESGDYGELCRDIREARRQARAAHGVPCPVCIEKVPRAHPSILLPEQRCKIHGYRDPRQRTRETEYLHRVEES